METMEEPHQTLPTVPARPFRLDVPLHDLLQQRPLQPRDPSLMPTAVSLPEAVFPQHPELLHDINAEDVEAHERVLGTGKRHWPASHILKSMRGWMVPYFKSRILPGEFQPIIAYLFTGRTTTA